MTRSILSAIALAVATGGLALAGGGDVATAGERSPFSLKPVVDMDTLGAKGEPASMIKRRSGSPANNSPASAHALGNQGAPASMLRRSETGRGYTNVVPAGPERTGNAGRPASLSAR